MSVATEIPRETTTETVNRTVPVRLETSQVKNDAVRAVIDEQQDIREWVAAHIVTFPSYEWDARMGMYGQIKDTELWEEKSQLAGVAQAAVQKVGAMFDSWASNGKEGARPSFGDGQYCSVRTDYVDLVKNDAGFGLHLQFEPYSDGHWWGIDTNPYVTEYLEQIVADDNDMTVGETELHLDDDGDLWAHLTVSWEVDVLKAGDVDRTLGVDLNVDPLVVAAVRDTDGTIDHVEFESGAEFKHHRERLKRRRAEAQRVRRDQKVLWQEYTEHIANVASRRVVDVAAEHAPVVINMEDLTNYREDAVDPIHDWPYALIQEKIAYKATERGIPVRTVDPRYTSVTCRQCGVTNSDSRANRDFACVNCGYEVHADANAAMNIAAGGVDS